MSNETSFAACSLLGGASLAMWKQLHLCFLFVLFVLKFLPLISLLSISFLEAVVFFDHSDFTISLEEGQKHQLPEEDNETEIQVRTGVGDPCIWALSC